MASEKIRIHQVPSSPRTQELFHEGAVQYLSMLMLRFHEEWKQCLERRQRKKIELNQGKLPQFLEETRDVRTSRWCVLSPPAQLLDRKVDIVVANLHIASNLEDALLSVSFSYSFFVAYGAHYIILVMSFSSLFFLLSSSSLDWSCGRVAGKWHSSRL